MKALIVARALLLDWLRRRDRVLIGLVFPVALLLILSSMYSVASGLLGTFASAVTYLLPGVIAAFAMVNGVFLLGTATAELKEDGMLKRMASTPLSRLDWIAGILLTQLSLVFVMSIAMLLIGVLVVGLPLLLNFYGLIFVVLECFLFSAVGLLVARVGSSAVRAADIGATIAFVSILLGGTLWPVKTMPGYLQSLSSVLPLTIIENGMRSSLLAGGAETTGLDLGVTAGLAAVFLALGWIFSNWDA